MRKNVGRILITLIALFTIINPMIVRADAGQIAITTASTNTAVGAEVVLFVETTNNYGYSLDFKFDQNVFEFVDASASINPFVGPYSGDTLGTISKNVTDGKLTLNYTYGNFDKVDYVSVIFKVKSSPSNGSSNITVNNVGNTYQGTGNKTIAFNVKEKECPSCPTCEKDEVSCPVCEECEKCEIAVDTNKETTSSESKGTDSKDILLYSALGACGFLAVVVVILAFRKK